MKNNRIYLSPPHMNGEEKQLLNHAFDSNWIAPLGPNVDGFENEMAYYLNSTSACALASGSAALHLALRILDVKKGLKNKNIKIQTTKQESRFSISRGGWRI